MIIASDKTSFYLDDCCFTALVIFFVLTCASILSIYFLCTDKVEVAIEVIGSVHVLKKSGGGKNTHSVFEVFSLC